MRGREVCKQHSDTPTGRPTKFNEETRSKIVEALRAGVFAATAAEYGGISYETLRTWMRRGEDDRAAGRETEYATFSAVVGQVIATVEVRAIGLIQQAAQRDWRAAAWWAEHALPAKYGKREAKPIEPTAGTGLKDLLGDRQPVAISPDARERIVAILAEDDEAKRIQRG